VAAYIAGSEEGSENYGVTADQCAEFCTMAAGIQFMVGVAEGLCSSAGYSVLVEQISVTPQGSPMALQVNVKKMPDRRRLDSTATGVCHCHSYEEIKCDAAGDALYDEHIVELQTYCQGVVDGTDLTCPFKCFQPWEVMHLYYMECDTRPVHSLFTQIEATGKCHMASASPSGDSACMMDSSTEKDGATTTTQLGDASAALAAAGCFRGFQSLGLAMVAGSLLISAY
jgi:hypothetical protein